MMNYKQTLLISLFSVLLASCSGDNNNDLIKYIHQMKQRKLKAIEPIPTITPLPVFKFPHEDNRRNPFKIMNQKKHLNLYVPNRRRIKQTLEAYPLDALKFVGTITQDNQKWGLIMQPDSKITHVCIGDYLGQNYGRMVAIKNNSIKLEESIKSSAGKWEKHNTTLVLYTDKLERS
jgi:type IV pilus assembly protein PilP